MLKTPAGFVLTSKVSSTSQEATHPVLSSTAALLDGRFEHPVWTFSPVPEAPSIEGS